MTTLPSESTSSPRRNLSSPSLLSREGASPPFLNFDVPHDETTEEDEEDALGAMTFRPRLHRRRRPVDGDDSSVGFAGGSERSDYELKRSKSVTNRRKPTAVEFGAASGILSNPTDDDVHSDSALGLSFGHTSGRTGSVAFGRGSISGLERGSLVRTECIYLISDRFLIAYLFIFTALVPHQRTISVRARNPTTVRNNTILPKSLTHASSSLGLTSFPRVWNHALRPRFGQHGIGKTFAYGENGHANVITMGKFY